MRVLVTGATGFVGSHLVPALLSADHEVSVLVRDRDGYGGPDDVTVFEGDLLDPGSFDAALDRVEAAYYLVHSLRAKPDSVERERRAATNFVAAAEDAGAERVLYLCGLDEEDGRLSRHLTSRCEAERVLADADFAVTSLRAAIITGDGSAGFEAIRQLVVRLPVMFTLQWVDTPRQPTAIDDAIAYLVGALDVPELAGRTVEIGGPEPMGYKQMMARTAEIVTGRRPVIVPVSALTPKLSASLVTLVTDAPRSVTQPLMRGMKNAVVVRNGTVRRYTSIELTPFETEVRRAVGGGAATGPTVPKSAATGER